MEDALVKLDEEEFEGLSVEEKRKKLYWIRVGCRMYKELNAAKGFDDGMQAVWV